MRLTEKHLRFELGARLAPLYWINDYDVALEYHNGQYGGGNAINKLGQLEDIEEELGIDLITLFKVLKQGHIWIKVYDDLSAESFEKDIGTIIERKALNITLSWIDTIDYESLSHKFNFLLKDYGKTWALTKEELL